METKHTPGPWFTKRNGYSTVYIEAKIGGGWIQEIAACGPNANGQYEQEANARLIAAAPELLDFAEEFVCAWEDGMAGDSFLLRIAKSAIAKATGSQS